MNGTQQIQTAYTGKVQGGAWRWALEWNFLDTSTFSTQDLGVAAGAKTINSKSFTLVNGGAYLDTLKINTGGTNGLKADLSAANSTYDTNGDTCPHLTLPLTSVVADYVPRMPVRVWAVIDASDADAATELVGVFCGTSNGARSGGIGAGYTTQADAAHFYRNQGAAVTDDGNTADTYDTVMVEFIGGTWSFYAGSAVGGAFPDYDNMTAVGYASSNLVATAANVFASTDILGFWWASGNTSDNFEASIHRFGVQYIPRSV